MNEKYEQILSLAKYYEEETAELLKNMIKIPSFSGKEKNVIEFLKNQMEKYNFDEVKVDGIGNVIGRIGQGKKIIALDAHIDTVYPGDLSQWKFDPFDSEIENGRVTGRGTVDQKSGMASMIMAGKIINELKLNKDYTILFTGTVMEEDCDGLCWQYLLNEEKIIPELVVITEPTNLNIYRGHRGRMEITVEVKGLSCHGSAPERGDNAIYKIAKLILEIEKLNELLKVDPFLGKGTITVTQIFFNSPSQCAVPDYAKIQIDRRLTNGEDKELAISQIKQCAKLAGVDDAIVKIPIYEEPAYTGKIYSTEKYYPTWTLDENSKYLISAKNTFTQLFAKEPFIDKWTFSTNGVAISGMKNIPCIGFGPGNEIYAHAPNEFVPIEHLSNAAAFYAGLVFELNNRVQ